MSLRTRSLWSVAFIVLALGAAACGDAAPSSGDPVAAGPSAEGIRDGIRVSLTLDRQRLPSGDRTLAIVTVENGSQERRFYRGGGCDFLADIRIETAAPVRPEMGDAGLAGMPGRFKALLLPTVDAESTGSFLDERFADPTQIVCTADLGVNVIDPGNRLEMRAIWNGEINGTVAAPGPANVVAAFPYLGPAAPQGMDGFDQPSIDATIAVEVVDAGIRLLSPGQAIDAALANPDFAAWLTAAGDMSSWDGVSLEGQGHTMVVILSVNAVAGRASVDRVTGAVAFEKRPDR